MFFTPNGHKIDNSIVEEVCDVLDKIFEDGDKFAREQIPLADVEDSVGTFAHREFYKYLRTCTESDEIIKMKEGIFNWRLLQEKTDNACKSVYEMSLYAWGEYMECPGIRYLELQHGFQSVLDVIIQDIPDECIKLNTAVKTIFWGMPKPNIPASDCVQNYAKVYDDSKKPNGYPVQVLTASGEMYNADHVIVTSSVGFLKKSAHTLFKPLLPNEKLAVVHRMGFGTVDKIFLEYEDPWWGKDCDGIQFAWNHEEPFVLNCIDNKEHAQYLRNDWYHGIQGFDSIHGHPCLLEGWIAGDEAEAMENIPDHIVLEICHELLQRFTGNTQITKPSRIIRSAWHSDSFTRGSYSYMKAGYTAADCDVLAKPLCHNQVPCLLFAGEATHREYFSTTHGALLSGQREAKRILSNHTAVSAHDDKI